jgi:ribosomal protein L39E
MTITVRIDDRAIQLFCKKKLQRYAVPSRVRLASSNRARSHPTYRAWRANAAQERGEISNQGKAGKYSEWEY